MHVINWRGVEEGDISESPRGALREADCPLTSLCVGSFPIPLGINLEGSRIMLFSDSRLSTPLLVTIKGVGKTMLPSHAPVHLGKSFCGAEMFSSTHEKRESP